jgi:hypothetical protein
MAESTKDLVAKRDMQLRMFDNMEENGKNGGKKGQKNKKAPKSVQGAGNMPLSDAKAAKQVEILKAQNKEKEVKKMNRGGMARKMITEADVPESGPTKPMTGGPQPKKKKRAPMGMDQGSGGAMPRMKKGGKVRGCGMARGGRVCKMVKMKGA